VKYGTIIKSEKDKAVILVQLPQIPETAIYYRVPDERETNGDKIDLSKRDLSHIPLFEGEEKCKYLFLGMNQIFRIDNLVSLPNLTYLDLADNGIKRIENLKQLELLKVLLLAKNKITQIENLSHLQHLEILDLQSNRIKNVDGLSSLRHLKYARGCSLP
jgi:leucine-rich repeat-containing protein 49